MADYTKSKSVIGGVFPEGTVESPWQYLEPLITPEQLRARWLFGVPLVSATVDPLTNTRQVITDDLLLDLIQGAVGETETRCHLRITPQQVKTQLAYDRPDFVQFGFFKLPHHPVASIEELNIRSSDDVNFFTFPLEWISMGQAHKGQINILPLSPATTGAAFASLAGSPGFLITVAMALSWIPSYFQCTYTVGFPNLLVPRIINDIVGITCAINVLGLLTTTYLKNSFSLSIDSLSQSQSSPGPEIFRGQIAALEDKRAKLQKSLKAIFGNLIVTTST